MHIIKSFIFSSSVRDGGCCVIHTKAWLNVVLDVKAAMTCCTSVSAEHDIDLRMLCWVF